MGFQRALCTELRAYRPTLRHVVFRDDRVRCAPHFTLC
jgi:hypothetical protein